MSSLDIWIKLLKFPAQGRKIDPTFGFCTVAESAIKGHLKILVSDKKTTKVKKNIIHDCFFIACMLKHMFPKIFYHTYIDKNMISPNKF